MKKFSLFFLLILLHEIIISVDSQSPALMKFVLQWPPTFCIQLNSATPRGRCEEPIPQRKFILHGLWPANAQGNSLECTTENEPNWNQVFTKTIENQLMTFWSPLRENSRNWDLWKHEWRAHGVCGGTTAQVYFNTAIKINNMIQEGNLFNYLKTSGIIACDSLAFSKTEIVTAIQKVFVKSATLNVYTSCIQANDTHFYLSEVTLCTNVGGTSFTSCPGVGPKTCRAGAQIMLPHPKPQQVILQEETNGIYHTFERSWIKYAFNK